MPRMVFPEKDVHCDGSPMTKSNTTNARRNARRYALHQRLKKFFSYSAKGHTIEIYGDKADIVPIRIRRVLRELQEVFGYQVQYVTYDTSPIQTRPMFLTFKNDKTEIIINLSKVTAVARNGASIDFLGEVILKQITPDQHLYGLATIETITYENEALAVRSLGIINRALSSKKI